MEIYQIIFITGLTLIAVGLLFGIIIGPNRNYLQIETVGLVFIGIGSFLLIGSAMSIFFMK